MRDRCYLIIDSYGVRRMAKKIPDLKAGEICFGLNVEIPEALFARPVITASVIVDPGSVPPVAIDAGKLEAIEQHIRDGVGVDVMLEVIQPEED